MPDIGEQKRENGQLVGEAITLAFMADFTNVKPRAPGEAIDIPEIPVKGIIESIEVTAIKGKNAGTWNDANGNVHPRRTMRCAVTITEPVEYAGQKRYSANINLPDPTKNGQQAMGGFLAMLLAAGHKHPEKAVSPTTAHLINRVCTWLNVHPANSDGSRDFYDRLDPLDPVEYEKRITYNAEHGQPPPDTRVKRKYADIQAAASGGGNSGMDEDGMGGGAGAGGRAATVAGPGTAQPNRAGASALPKAASLEDELG